MQTRERIGKYMVGVLVNQMNRSSRARSLMYTVLLISLSIPRQDNRPAASSTLEHYRTRTSSLWAGCTRFLVLLSPLLEGVVPTLTFRSSTLV